MAEIFIHLPLGYNNFYLLTKGMNTIL